MIDFDDFASEIFQILRAYGRDMVLYDENGTRVYEPTEARRMYVTGDNILVSISEDGDNSSMRVYLSPSMHLAQVQGFIETLKTMANKANLLFHVKKFDKEIRPQDFATKASVNEQENLNMNLYEGMYGTSKSSYLKLENAKMIVRHSERVKENMIGARGRSIDKIFVEDAQGQRFLFPVNMLSGARAMTQHVNQGGTFADDVGQQIVRMANDFRNLARVAQHTSNNTALPESVGPLRESIMHAMKGVKLTFNRMYEARSYVRESARILETSQLMEDGVIAEKLEALKGMLGEHFEEDVLGTVARYVELPEAADSVTEDAGLEASQEVTEDDMADVAGVEEAEQVEEARDENGEPLGRRIHSVSVGNRKADVFTKPSTGEFVGIFYVDGQRQPGSDYFTDDREDAIATVGGWVDQGSQEAQDSEMPAPNNSAVREFEQWMEEFDPDSRVSEAEEGEEGEEGGEAIAEETFDENEEQLDEFFNGKPESGDIVTITDNSTGHAGEQATVVMAPSDLGGAFLLKLDSGEEVHMDSTCFKFGGSEKIELGGADAVDETELDEYRVKKQDMEPEMSVHDVKMALMSLKMRYNSMSPFDPEKTAVGSQITGLEQELGKLSPYGKQATMPELESAEAPAEGEELDEYRVKKQDMAPEMSVHDIKSTLMALQSQYDSLSPFDPEKIKIGSQITGLKSELSKMTPYGRTLEVESEEPEEAVDEAAECKVEDEAEKQATKDEKVEETFDAELELLARLAGMRK